MSKSLNLLSKKFLKPKQKTWKHILFLLVLIFLGDLQNA